MNMGGTPSKYICENLLIIVWYTGKVTVLNPSKAGGIWCDKRDNQKKAEVRVSQKGVNGFKDE